VEYLLHKKFCQLEIIMSSRFETCFPKRRLKIVLPINLPLAAVKMAAGNLAPIEAKILLRRRSAQKIGTDSGKKLKGKTKINRVDMQTKAG